MINIFRIFIIYIRKERLARSILFIFMAFSVMPSHVVAENQVEKRKVVLQLTDNSQQKQALILNVADNLLNMYGKNVELEVVAFGPGLQLLFNESTYNQRISNLAKQGVKFSACRNTYKKMEKALGDELKLHEYAKETSGGAARIIELVEQGYVLLRP